MSLKYYCILVRGELWECIDKKRLYWPREVRGGGIKDYFRSKIFVIWDVLFFNGMMKSLIFCFEGA